MAGLCSCRTSSLRIFVQSLTDLRLPSTRHHQQLLRLRPHPSLPLQSASFTAASAPRFPRQQPWHTSPTKSTPDRQNDPRDLDTHEQHTPDSESVPPPLDSAALDNAKRQGAVMEFSPESIDALVQNLELEEGQGGASAHRSGPRRRPGKSHIDGFRHDPDSEYAGSEGRRMPSTGEAGQLRRRKILPKQNAKTTEDARPPRKREEWMIQKEALREKFPDGWRPRKRLSPDALDGIRALHAQFPGEFTTETLAERFEVPAEAIRRILKSKWRPSSEEEEQRQDRWFNRGKGIWTQLAELGTKPPRRWRREGIVRAPEWNEKRGHKQYWPYQPRRPDEPREDKRSAQRRASGKLL